MEGTVLSRGPAHEAQLREINVPTSVMCGEQGALFPCEEHERLAAAIPNATLKVYPETGHDVHWERLEQVVRDVETFMKDTRHVQSP
jgi:non-heme chloroperoxidase